MCVHFAFFGRCTNLSFQLIMDLTEAKSESELKLRSLHEENKSLQEQVFINAYQKILCFMYC